MSNDPPGIGAARRARARRIATLSAGWMLLVTGTFLLVLPGPGLVLILAGLALLGREVAWARKLRSRIESMMPRRQRRASGDPMAVRDVVQ